MPRLPDRRSETPTARVTKSPLKLTVKGDEIELDFDLAAFGLLAAHDLHRAPHGGFRDEDRLSLEALGRAYYNSGDYERAARTFRYQEETYPQGPLAQDAAYFAGESLLKQAKYAEAIAAYAKVHNPLSKEYQSLALLHAAEAAESMC